MPCKSHFRIQFVLFFALGLTVFWSSCRAPGQLPRADERELEKLISESQVFETGFTGFHLYNPLTEEVLFDWNGEKHFAPASNIKILTLYTARRVLGDSIPVFRYQISGDTAIIKSTAGPTLFNPDFPREVEAETILKELLSLPVLEFLSSGFDGKRFGPGWGWDGFPFNYQRERSALPLYGNKAVLTFYPGQKKAEVSPDFPGLNIVFKKPEEKPSGDRPTAWRAEESNTIYYFSTGNHSDTVKLQLPLRMDTTTLVQTLGSKGETREFKFRENAHICGDFTSVYSAFPDSVYRRMMWKSDNFVAEQLLLATAGVLRDTLDTQLAIDFALDSLQLLIPGVANWMDGSGLSRYNLATPSGIARALNLILEEYGEDFIKDIFPAGGVSGTLKNWYSGGDQPFVFAKTGTLRNNHSLSGYLIGKSEQIYIFSFMHSNFPGSSIPHREEMEKVLYFLREKL